MATRRLLGVVAWQIATVVARGAWDDPAVAARALGSLLATVCDRGSVGRTSPPRPFGFFPAETLRLRSSLLLLLAVLAVLAMACKLPISSEPADALRTCHWRHTRDGWESSDHWAPPPPAFRPALNPATVAGMQLLVVLTALLGPQAAQAETAAAVRRKAGPSDSAP